MVSVRQRRRAGFTLIEILVVIGIIAVLATLTTSAIMKFLGAQPVTTTRTELKSLQTAFHKKWIEVTEHAAKGEESIRDPFESKLMGLAQNQPQRMKVIWIKIRQRQAFPQTFFEALNPITFSTPAGNITIPALTSYKTYLTKYGITTGNNANPQPYESAVCLLMAMRRNVSGGGEMSEDTFGVGTFVTQITDAKNHPNMVPTPCLVDAWKNPILFCRWPLGNSMATVADPADPLSLLSAKWATSLAPAQLTSFQTALHVVGAASTGRLTPMLGSMGPDGKAGLTLGNPGTAAHWTDSAPDATDNIYSNNLP